MDTGFCIASIKLYLFKSIDSKKIKNKMLFYFLMVRKLI